MPRGMLMTSTLLLELDGRNDGPAELGDRTWEKGKVKMRIMR